MIKLIDDKTIKLVIDKIVLLNDKIMIYVRIGIYYVGVFLVIG